MSETIDGNAGTRIVHAPNKPVTPPRKYLTDSAEKAKEQNPLDSKSDNDNINTHSVRSSQRYSPSK